MMTVNINIGTLSKSTLLSALLLLIAMPAQANEEQYEKLLTSYENLLEESDYEIDKRHYIISKRLYELSKEADDAEILLDNYIELPKEDRQRFASTFFKKADAIQSEFTDSLGVQTSVCWASLIENKMDLANTACNVAYNLDFMYAPAMVNKAHILYHQGNKTQAKALVAQSLVGNDQTDDWQAIINEDFDTLPHIYSSKQNKVMKKFVTTELKKPWKTKYDAVEEAEYNADIESEDYASYVPYITKQQKIIAKRFGKNSLINGYFLSELGTYETMAGGGFDDVKNNTKAYKHFKNAMKVFKKHGISNKNSNMASEASLFLDEYK